MCLTEAGGALEIVMLGGKNAIVIENMDPYTQYAISIASWNLNAKKGPYSNPTNVSSKSYLCCCY